MFACQRLDIFKDSYTLSYGYYPQTYSAECKADRQCASVPPCVKKQASRNEPRRIGAFSAEEYVKGLENTNQHAMRRRIGRVASVVLHDMGIPLLGCNITEIWFPRAFLSFLVTIA